jgi:hypothetical protein
MDVGHRASQSSTGNPNSVRNRKYANFRRIFGFTPFCAAVVHAVARHGRWQSA